MTEKEKMLSGIPYNANDTELDKERIYAKRLCQEYNNILIGNDSIHILNKLLGKVGVNPIIQPVFWCDYGYNISLGDNFYSNHNLVILDCAKVTFGDNVFIGPNCGFYTATHPLDFKTRIEGIEEAFPINVGNNVWIGGSATVLAGVNIGDNVVVGAGSLVNKDVPSNCVVAGVPAKIIRKL